MILPLFMLQQSKFTIDQNISVAFLFYLYFVTIALKILRILASFRKLYTTIWCSIANLKAFSRLIWCSHVLPLEPMLCERLIVLLRLL
jgi:hypothetical protein